MSLRTPGSQRTEASHKPLTQRQSTLRVDMQIQTLVSVRAIPIPAKKVALWHFTQVVLVEKFAVIALFAEAAQPVLAD